MTTSVSSKEIACSAARAADEKKASDIVIQDVSGMLNVTDYFVICTAANRRRVEAVAQEIEDKLRKDYSVKPFSREGVEDAKWVLLDYGCVVVHIFQPAERDFYCLEQLWEKAPTIDVAAAGIKDPVYSSRIATLLGKESNEQQ